MIHASRMSCGRGSLEREHLTKLRSDEKVRVTSSRYKRARMSCMRDPRSIDARGCCRILGANKAPRANRSLRKSGEVGRSSVNRPAYSQQEVDGEVDSNVVSVGSEVEIYSL